MESTEILNVGITPYFMRRVGDYLTLCFSVSSSDMMYDNIIDKYRVVKSGSDLFHLKRKLRLLYYSEPIGNYLDSCNVMFVYVKENTDLTDEELDMVTKAMERIVDKNSYSEIAIFIGGKCNELC